MQIGPGMIVPGLPGLAASKWAARLLCQDFNQVTGFQLMTDMIFAQLCNAHSQYRHSPHRLAIIGKQALVGHAIQRPTTIAQCRNLG